jgi:serine/threonine protein phosphatase PrpC
LNKIDSKIQDNHKINQKPTRMERIEISEHVEQMCKGQDYTVSGQIEIDGQPVKYAAVFDGHGRDNVIRFIRNIKPNKMDEIMATDDPATNMFHYINDAKPKLCIHGECSGSTMCVARIFPTHVEIINVGDSQAVVFKNGKIEFISETHDYGNPKEKERLESTCRIHYAVESKSMKIVSETEMRVIKSFYIVHTNDSVQLAVSQALGHDGKTGVCPDRTIIPYSNIDDIRIVLGSDGFFDMVLRERDSDRFLEQDLLDLIDMPCEAIMKRTIDRWVRQWNMYYSLINPELSMSGQYDKDQCDDVAVVKVDILPETPVSVFS